MMMKHHRKAKEGQQAEAVAAEQGQTAQAIEHKHEGTGAPKGFVAIAIVYLLGLFMGALDMGIVAPGRTVIQNDLGVDDQLGVWIVTIYTLAYAASIPLMGKLADRRGRKPIYLVCVALFGFGSLCCGLAKVVGSFYFLLAARVVQAIGGGGIMPIATAEFGTAFPPEKRGMALGLTGGVFGIANVFGSSIGSLILDIFGQSNWQFIFYLNVPICVFILIAGVIKLRNNTLEEVKPMDILGTVVLVLMVLSLLYGLRMIKFMDFLNSVSSTDVWPFLLVFVLLIPVFILVERRAADPIINLSYFTNRNIVITLIVSMTTGVIMMGAVFIPQFAENALYMPSGKGGYWVILLGVFAGVGSPMSGTLIDKFGVKPVLGFGLASSVVGALFLALVAAPHPSIATVAISFILIGLGMGFVMGTPVNYMMLENTREEESNSALATLSLMRSIGTAVAPALMVVFLAQSGLMVQDRIAEVMPTHVQLSQFPYQQEVQDKLDEMKADPDYAEMLAESEFPDLEEMESVDVDMTGDMDEYTVPDDVKEQLESSDITTIVENTKMMTHVMFEQMKPDIMEDIESGMTEGTDHIRDAQAEMDSAMQEMRDGIAEIQTGIDGISSGLSQQESARAQLVEMLPMLKKMEDYSSILDLMPDAAKSKLPDQVREQLAGVKTVDDLNGVIAQLDTAIQQMSAQAEKIPDPNAKAQMQESIESMQQSKAMLQEQIPTVSQMSSYNSVVDLMPESAKSAVPADVLSKLGSVKTTADLNALIAELDSAMATMRSSQDEMRNAQAEMESGIAEMQTARDDLDTLLMQIEAMEEGIPGAFDEAEEDYLQQIDEKAGDIEYTFQMTLGEGFSGMFFLVAGISAFGFILLMFYKGKRKEKKQDDEATVEPAQEVTPALETA